MIPRRSLSLLLRLLCLVLLQSQLKPLSRLRWVYTSPLHAQPVGSTLTPGAAPALMLRTRPLFSVRLGVGITAASVLSVVCVQEALGAGRAQGITLQLRTALP